MKKKCFIVVLLSIVISYSVGAMTMEEIVSVSGYAEIFIKPDIARTSFSVSETRSSVNSAQKYTSEIVENTLRLLGRMGVSKARITTTGTSVNPVYRWNSSQEKQELIGYNVKREIRAELNDLKMLGPLMEKVGKLGITHIAAPRFDSTEREKTLKEVFELAFLDAKETASILANAADRNLGDVIAIDASLQNPKALTIPRDRSSKLVKRDVKETNYLAGDISISTHVNVSFRLD